MRKIELTQVPVARTGMLIRRPVAEVFEAFVDPDITRKFWFTRGSGRLEAGKQVQWDWDMYGISIPVTVKAVEPNRRIVIEWPGYGSPTTVEWTFQPLADRTTFYRTDLAFAEDPAVPRNPHGFLTAVSSGVPLVVEIALGAQRQIASFFASDGTVVIHPEPARFFETPIAGPLPEDLNYIL